MDTLSIVLIAIGAALVAGLLWYTCRRRMQGLVESECRKALEDELCTRLRSLDAACAAVFYESVDTYFPALDLQTADDANPLVHDLIFQVASRCLGSSCTVVDVAHLHDTLTSDDTVMNHCKTATSQAYQSMDKLLSAQGNNTHVFSKGGLEIPLRATTMQTLFCVVSSMVSHRYHKTKTAFYYNLAHLVCCGRKLVSRRNSNEDEEVPSDEAESDGDVIVELAATHDGLRKYLYTGPSLKRKYAEVTQHARDLVFVESNGDIKVLSCSAMLSQSESASWLQRRFDRHFFANESVLFGAGGLREAAFTFLFNAWWAVRSSGACGSNDLPETYRRISSYNSAITQWALETQRKSVHHTIALWKEKILDRCAEIIQNQQSNVTQAEPLAPSQPRDINVDVRAIVKQFWQKEIHNWRVALQSHDEGGGVPLMESMQHCCGCCLPELLELEASYASDAHTVTKTFNRKLRQSVHELFYDHQTVVSARRMVGAMKAQVTEALLSANRSVVEANDRVRAAAESTPAFVGSEVDDAPMPPERTDIDNDEASFSPREMRDDEGPDIQSSWIIRDCIQRAYSDVERLVSQSLHHMEVEHCDRITKANAPRAAEAMKQAAQSVCDAAKSTVFLHAAQISVLVRTYKASRDLCAIGRRVRSEGDVSQLAVLATALQQLRDLLMESRELIKQLAQLSTESSATYVCPPENFISMDQQDGGQPHSDVDDVSGKRVLAFPWHRILLSYNYFAEMQQKQKITLQFIYDD